MGDSDIREDRFVTALMANGYVVNKGSASLIEPANFVDNQTIDSAAGNNSGQPYKRLQIPSITEKEDPADRSMGIFRLQPYEAIIYLGLTPPEGDYFSFTPFIWSRHYGKTIAKGDWIFAALGDPLNNSQIKTEVKGSPFHQNTMVIFTADQGVSESLVKQATAAGYPKSMINTYIIPSELLQMGIDRSDDSFLILVRAANMYDPDAAEFYNNDDQYASVFRVTPKPDRIPNPLRPFSTPAQRKRRAMPEDSLIATGKSLADSLDDLKNAIQAQTPNIENRSFESIRWFAESRDVLETADPQLLLYHKFVAGEASDTPYLRTSMKGVPANFTLRQDEMVIVYGVNHAATGLATYSNFSVYGENILNPDPDGPYVFGCNDPLWCGVAGMASKDSNNPRNENVQFCQSARQFIPDDPNVDYLYAVRVLREPLSKLVKQPYVTVPEPGHETPATGIGLNDPVCIGYRAYLNPATGSGPSYADITPDRAIWFKVK